MPQEEALNSIKSIKATGDSPCPFTEASAPAPYFYRSVNEDDMADHHRKITPRS